MFTPPHVAPLSPPPRTLMGPGPSEVHPEVLEVMSKPLVGHLDPAFIEIMDEVQELLRYAFQTANEWTIPVSGTGSAAMEAAIGNVVVPGDTVLVPGNGYFGERMAQMAERAGGDVSVIEGRWGEPIDIDTLQTAVDETDPDVVCLVHAETSTGVLQHDLAKAADIVHENGGLLIVDCVTSLGGVELRVDEWGIDVAYSGPQKCLSCPPGASPLTLNDRAMEKIEAREEPMRCWYLDLQLIADYWGSDRSYHHTAPITNVYAIREALRLVAEEGLEARWDRHEQIASSLVEQLEALGLDTYVSSEDWLPTLTTIQVPDSVDDNAVIEQLRTSAGIEIAGGLGSMAGEIWRIGCMGHSAREENISLLVDAMASSLEDQGFEPMVD